jgi:PAS domain S-box-containing protein
MAERTMGTPPGTVFKRFAAVAGASAATLGLLVILGWIFGIGALTSVASGFATMKINTAVGFVASGLALRLTAGDSGGWTRWLALGLAVFVILLGAATLGEYWSGGDWRIDQLLMAAADPAAAHPGRMAGGTALCFLLLGVSLVGVGSAKAERLARLAAGSVGLLALLGLTGYAFGVSSLYAVPTFSSMALHTAATFLVLAAGVLATRPEGGVVGLLAGEGAGSTIARRLLPATLAVPAILGWLRLRGQAAGLYGTEFGSALLTLALMAALAAAVLWVASSLQDTGRRLQRADRMFRLVVESAPEAMIMADQLGRVVLVNGQAERLLGYDREEMLGRSVDMLVPTSLRGAHAAHRKDYLGEPTSRPMGLGRDLFALRKDGMEVPVEVGLNPIETEEGKFVLAALVDITERVRAADALKQKADELARSNAELEQFAYVASHDLQEPLRMVVSYTELLEERNQGKIDEKTDKYIRYIVEGGKRMQGLVNDLLKYSRIGKTGQPFRAVDVKAVVDYVIADLRGAIADSGGKVDYGDLPFVSGDERQLAMVFQNLIANAVKFRGEAAPCVTVTAVPSDEFWEFCVADNGIGIDPRYNDRIFQMFQRLHERGAYEGSGIGLAVAKKIVEHHGGHIWLESEPGSGSRFFFTLRSAREAVA